MVCSVASFQWQDNAFVRIISLSITGIHRQSCTRCGNAAWSQGLRLSQPQFPIDRRCSTSLPSEATLGNSHSSDSSNRLLVQSGNATKDSDSSNRLQSHCTFVKLSNTAYINSCKNKCTLWEQVYEKLRGISPLCSNQFL